MVPIHTKPKNTFAEINYLPGVFTSAAGHFGTHTGVILGDLNCGCEFLSKTKYQQLKLVKDKSFYWWITNDAGTTTKKGHACPFDRYSYNTLLHISVQTVTHECTAACVMNYCDPPIAL